MNKDDYTEQEWERILVLIDKLPSRFYGGDCGDREWESIVQELHGIIAAKDARIET